MSVPASDVHALAQFLLNLAELRVRSGEATDLAAGLAGALGVIGANGMGLMARPGDEHLRARMAMARLAGAVGDAARALDDAGEQAHVLAETL